MNDSTPPLKARLRSAAGAVGWQLLAFAVVLGIALAFLIGGPIIALLLVGLAFAVLVSPKLRRDLESRATKRQSSSAPDWRPVLHVTKSAPWPVVKAAYKALAFTHHPDRDPKGAERMSVINAAWALARLEFQESRS